MSGSAAAPPGDLRGLRVLLVDNYDSFTYNLAHLCASLTGSRPEVVRNDSLSAAEAAAREPDAIVLSPGPGTPEIAADVGVCPDLIRQLDTIPILGVCLGHQAIALAFGARVVPAPVPMHGRLSTVRHDGRGLFAGLSNPLTVVRYHSLVVDEATLLPPLRATAWTGGDGEPRLVMALSHEARPLHGVQFHPESILTRGGAALLASFLSLASARRSVRRRPSAPALPAAPAPRRAVTVRARTIALDVPFVDPEQAFVALHRAAETAFWLDGTERYSYLGEAARETVRVRGGRLERSTPAATERREGDPFALIEELLARRSLATDARWPFTSGYVGWLGYEMKRSCEGGDGPAGALPDALLMLADRVLCVDRERREARLVALLHEGQGEAAARRWLDEERARLAAAQPAAPAAAPAPAGPPLTFHLDADRARYRHAVERIHALLAAGETYEICLTTQARAALSGGPPFDPLLLHRLLRRTNPAPWSSYLRFPGGAVVSASPERFVRVGPGGAIESRPIKGTRPRGGDLESDRRLRSALAESEKDRAENLMIVDLVRHDLGRVCCDGTVEVPALMQVEAHPTLFQLVSTVRGQLLPGVGPVAAVRSLFPGGSMTGAPKIRAMKIIGELEGAPRGVYSGALGSFGFDGAIDLAMAIRTAVIDGDEVSFGIGGAVVALSEAEDEFEEALLKGRALAGAIALAAGRPLAADDPFAARVAVMPLDGAPAGSRLPAG